jgi:hypothetical protein
MDPELVADAHDLLLAEADLVRASGMFGQDLAVADDADQQTRMLAFIGRES